MDTEFDLLIDTGSIEAVVEHDHNHQVVYPAISLALSFLVPIYILGCLVHR